MNTLMILNTPIRQDAQGRYSLNDVHRAAGGAKKRLPSIFINTSKAMALIREIDRRNGITVDEGAAHLDGTPAMFIKTKLGTYAGKELVLAYAQWMSPAFHLVVARAFEALGTEPDQSPLATEPDSTHYFAEQEAFTQNRYLLRCLYPSLEDMLNGLYELDQPLERRRLAQRIHQAWRLNDVDFGASTRTGFDGYSDAALGAFIRAWFKKTSWKLQRLKRKRKWSAVQAGRTLQQAMSAMSRNTGESRHESEHDEKSCDYTLHRFSVRNPFA